MSEIENQERVRLFSEPSLDSRGSWRQRENFGVLNCEGHSELNFHSAVSSCVTISSCVAIPHCVGMSF